MCNSMYYPDFVVLVRVTENDDGTTEQSASVLDGVLVHRHTGGTVTNRGVVDSNNVTVYVPHVATVTDFDGGGVQDYAHYVDYMQLSDDDKPAHWTLAPQHADNVAEQYMIINQMPPAGVLDYQQLRRGGYDVYNITQYDYHTPGRKIPGGWTIGGV